MINELQQSLGPVYRGTTQDKPEKNLSVEDCVNEILRRMRAGYVLNEGWKFVIYKGVYSTEGNGDAIPIAGQFNWDMPRRFIPLRYHDVSLGDPAINWPTIGVGSFTNNLFTRNGVDNYTYHLIGVFGGYWHAYGMPATNGLAYTLDVSQEAFMMEPGRYSVEVQVPIAPYTSVEGYIIVLEKTGGDIG